MPNTSQAFNTSILRPGLHKHKVLSIAKPGTIVAFYDTETTGLSPEIDDHIIEFAGIIGRVEKDYTITRLSDIQIYIKNRKPLDPDVVALTKITEEFLADITSRLTTALRIPRSTDTTFHHLLLIRLIR